MPNLYFTCVGYESVILKHVQDHKKKNDIKKPIVQKVTK